MGAPERIQSDLERRSGVNRVPTSEQAAKINADPLNQYDKYVVCKKGLVSWTFEDVPLSTPSDIDAAVEDLDDEALDFLAREILKLSKPSLFQTAPEAEADQKNG